MIDIAQEWEFFVANYGFAVGLIGICAITAFVLTPWTGVLARKLGALDLPTRLRRSDDVTRNRRVHTEAMPSLGGLAVVIALLVGLAVMVGTGRLEVTPLIISLVLGGAVITVLGFVDSVFDVPAKTQFLVHILTGLLVVLSGTKIENIEILGQVIDFTFLTFPLFTGDSVILIQPFADIITILWIVFVINAINWVSGIDGLAASMCFAAAITFMFIGVKYEVIFAAIISAALAGSILGFLPYNMPPARTFNGTIGDMMQGFLLAVLAISSGAKLTATFILLALPILDALWVLYFRFVKNRREIRNPLDILKISDKSHLHHRLMDIGFSVRQTLGIEFSIFLLFCVAAYYFAGFSTETIASIIAVFVCIVVFIVLSIMKRRGRTVKKAEKPTGPDASQTPEEKYAY